MKNSNLQKMIGSNTSVESDRKFESELETSNVIKRENPSRNSDLQNKNKNGKPEFWKTRIFKGTIGSNTSVESYRKFESELETSNDIKRGNPSRNPDLQNNNKNGKPEFWKTRIFKGKIGSNTSVESDRKFESELETSNDIKRENPSPNPDLQNNNKNGKPEFWKTWIFKGTISSNTCVESVRKFKSELENLNNIKRENPSWNPDLQNNNKNGKPEFWKTRIFKGTIGSNTSVESDRKFESELETSNDIKRKNPSRNPELQNKNKNGIPEFWKLEFSKERSVPKRALNPIESSSRNSKLQTT